MVVDERNTRYSGGGGGVVVVLWLVVFLRGVELCLVD